MLQFANDKINDYYFRFPEIIDYALISLVIVLIFCL